MGREISEGQREWLARESAVWRTEGLISEVQSRAVLDLYGTAAEAGEQRQSRALLMISTLAALLIGLGVLLLVGYNWEMLPAGVKVAMILAAVFAAHATGYRLRFGAGRPVAGDIACFLGCLVYGGGIALVGQIFHLSAGDASLYWWWALGVLPFALALDVLALHVLFAGLLAVWAGYEILGFQGLGGWLFGRWPRWLDGAYSLLPLVALGLSWAYRRRDQRAAALYAALIAWWVILQPFAWKLQENPVYLIGLVGGVLLVVAELHRAGDVMAVPWRTVGTLILAGMLVPLSFYTFNERVSRHANSVGMLITAAVMAALAAALLGLTAALKRGGVGKPGSGDGPDDVRVLMRREAMPLGVVAAMFSLALLNATLPELALVPTVVANAAMVALAFWLIRVGLRDDRARPFAAGTAYFLLWTVLRYADLFGNLGGMIGAALMFFLCGFALYGVALYWRRRNPGLNRSGVAHV